MSGEQYHNPGIQLYPSNRPLPTYPTIQEWVEASRPYGWPFIRTSEFILPPKPQVGSLQYHDWDSDQSDSGSYENSDQASTTDNTSSGSINNEGDDDHVMQDAEDQISDSEIADLKAECREVPWPNVIVRFDEQVAKQEALNRALSQLPSLEQAEAASMEAWDATAFVKLVEQWYELLAEMGHWEHSDIAVAPHVNHPVNVELGRALGFEEQVIDLMTKMPYISSKADQGNGYYRTVSDDTRLADYRQEADLRLARRPIVPLPVDHPDLDPWIMPLVFPNWYGFAIYLDTRLGVVRAHGTYNGPPENSPEWVKEQKDGVESNEDVLHIYRRAPLVPALSYIKTIIEAYRSLETIPLIQPSSNLLRRYYKREEILVGNMEDGQQYFDFYDAANMQKQALLELYQHHGWPTNWHRDEFLTSWNSAKEQIERTVKHNRAEFEQKKIQMSQEPSKTEEKQKEVSVNQPASLNDVGEPSTSDDRMKVYGEAQEEAVTSSIVEKWQMIDLTATELNEGE